MGHLLLGNRIWSLEDEFPVRVLRSIPGTRPPWLHADSLRSGGIVLKTLTLRMVSFLSAQALQQDQFCIYFCKEDDEEQNHLPLQLHYTRFLSQGSGNHGNFRYLPRNLQGQFALLSSLLSKHPLPFTCGPRKHPHKGTQVTPLQNDLP